MIRLPRRITLRAWTAVVLLIAVALSLPRTIWGFFLLFAYLLPGFVVTIYLFFVTITTVLIVASMPTLTIASAFYLSTAPRGSTWRDRARRTRPLWPWMRRMAMAFGVNLPWYLILARWPSLIHFKSTNFFFR